MSKARYAEAIADDPVLRRQEECAAFRKVGSMLEAAQTHGPGSRHALDAMQAVNTLWSALLEDLVKPENDLPVELRAKIISIGIFLLKEVEAIRSGRSSDFQTLREITESIAEGLA
jgi:flagellar biosynthesis activator protein FlaF